MAFDSNNPIGFGQSGVLVGTTRNRVLRNTYWLLALSLVPTVIGAWAGVATGFGALFAGSPGLSTIVFLVGAFGLMFAIERFKDSAIGVGLLLGFTFFMGLMLSRLLGFVLPMVGAPHAGRLVRALSIALSIYRFLRGIR